jgi:aminoglycoside phosphotransferase (APT) family kinase protein
LRIGGIAEGLRSKLAAVAQELSRRSRTLVHGDLQLDNIIFRRDAVVVLDWQTVSVGAAGRDIVPFLIGALGVADRREADEALLDRYVSRLAEHGVAYSVEELRDEGRLALLVLFAAMVVWLTGLDPADLKARERALQQAVVNDGRMAAALLDNNVEDLLSELVAT